jgi:hypothetical protein
MENTVYSKLLKQQQQAKELYDSISADIKEFEENNPLLLRDTLIHYFDKFVERLVALNLGNVIYIFTLSSVTIKADDVWFQAMSDCYFVDLKCKIISNQKQVTSIPVNIYTCKNKICLYEDLPQSSKEDINTIINNSIDLHKFLTDNIGEDY